MEDKERLKKAIELIKHLQEVNKMFGEKSIVLNEHTQKELLEILGE